MENTIPIEDQPISATFFDESRWLSDFVTPNEPDIQVLWRDLTRGMNSTEDKVTACWAWVARQVKYVPFVKASINIEGKSYFQNDLWQTPSLVTKTHIGNCANKAFLLTSLLRNGMNASQVHCVLGNLYNGHAAGHAWVEVNVAGNNYIVESTRDDVPLLDVTKAKRYEPVHYFNDQDILAVPGRTVMTPFQACYSSWLKDYLSWGYIHEGEH